MKNNSIMTTMTTTTMMMMMTMMLKIPKLVTIATTLTMTITYISTSENSSHNLIELKVTMDTKSQALFKLFEKCNINFY